MTDKIERSIEELYRNDPQRADAEVFGRVTEPSRRGFLNGAGLAAMGAAVGGAIPFAANMPGGLIPAAMAQGSPSAAPPPIPATPAAPKGPIHLKFPGKSDKLVVIGERPLVAETPEHLLDDDTTPYEKFFIRNNGQIPEESKEGDKWKFTVEGEVNNKLELTLGDLKSKYKAQTRRMVLECGGNGRSFYSPPASGNQWTNGGAGCAEWTGVRLADVLKAAGVKPAGIYTAHYSSDLHLSGDANRPTLSRGVRMAKAMDPDSMIVWAMNGQPLPNIHGGPVRLLIPGWPGSASQKWLTKIVIRDKEHDGPGMTGTSYRLAINPMVPGAKADPKNFKVMESMPVRSIITNPANGAKLAAGTKEIKLRGASWAGDLTVKQVDVSTDFGASWQRANLEKPKN
ncbi:MAG: sulfite oxidase, partial [Pseudolabrys sp.]|nr:sulfite oxidase [Pseudolabrys sp.]